MKNEKIEKHSRKMCNVLLTFCIGLLMWVSLQGYIFLKLDKPITALVSWGAVATCALILLRLFRKKKKISKE